MGWVTQDQIRRAREVDVLDYMLAHEPGNVRRVGRGYRLKDHDSIAVASGKWYWHSQKIGGRTALDYLTYVRGYSLVGAVCLLLGERPLERPPADIPETKPPAKRGKTDARAHAPQPAAEAGTPPERAPFAMPLRHKDSKRVIAYLQSRGIDRDLIMGCIDRGVLFESYPRHNAVFLGKDETGRTRYAAMRGTTSNYKCDADGSDKRYGFTLPPDDPNSKEAAIFESPVDALSHQTLCKQGFMGPFGGWRLSLGGTSVTALEHFINQHPEITHCLIATDNDEAGELAAARIAEMPGFAHERSPPIAGNDWNDTLQAMQRAERTQDRARHSGGPSL